MRLEHFQMIDRVLSVDPEGIAAEALVPKESPVFEGHFPGHPLVPGVLLVETMAQASGYLLLHRFGFARMPFLSGVRDARFRSFVAPETPLEVAARLEHDGSGYAVTRASISVGGRRVCDAALTFRTLPFPAPALEAAMRAQAARLGLGTGAADPPG